MRTLIHALLLFTASLLLSGCQIRISSSHCHSYCHSHCCSDGSSLLGDIVASLIFAALD